MVNQPGMVMVDKAQRRTAVRALLIPADSTVKKKKKKLYKKVEKCQSLKEQLPQTWRFVFVELSQAQTESYWLTQMKPVALPVTVREPNMEAMSNNPSSGNAAWNGRLISDCWQ